MHLSSLAKKLICFCQRDMVLVYFLAFAKLMSHLPLIACTNFRPDELSFMACGMHLDWGYVDDPPLVPWLARLSTELFGYSRFGLRLWPTIAGTISILLTGLMAKSLGGKYLAQILSALAVFAAPAFIINCSEACVFSYEPMCWLLVFFCLCVVVKTEDPRYWLLVGLAAGLGLLTKFTMLLVMGGLVLALLATPQRRLLNSVWPYIAALVALLALVPSFYWWSQHDWAGLEFLASVPAGNETTDLFKYVLGQITYCGWITVPLWLTGLYALLYWKPLRPYRALGITYLILFQFFVLTNGNIRYITPIYPVLMVAGALWVERKSRKERVSYLGHTYAAALAIASVVLIPVILSPKLVSESTFMRVLTCGMLGPDSRYASEIYTPESDVDWAARVNAIAQQYNRLPRDQKAKTIIFSEDSALDAAIDIYGQKHNLPNAACNAFSAYYWGAPNYSVSTVITAHTNEPSENFFSSKYKKRYVSRYSDIAPSFSDRFSSFRVTTWTGGKTNLQKNWPSLKFVTRKRHITEDREPQQDGQE